MGTPDAFLPILLMLIAAAIIGAALLFLNGVMGRKVRTLRKLGQYESGLPLLDASRKRISVKFFIVAMLFIVFDVEAVFLYPWAIVFRQFNQFKGFLFVEMVVFIGILMVGFIYVWKKGALDWE